MKLHKIIITLLFNMIIDNIFCVCLYIFMYTLLLT